MAQFIAILREQLPQVAPTQTKYRVTEMPSERTIRFYTANNLVDKPLAQDGHTRATGIGTSSRSWPSSTCNPSTCLL